METNNLYYEQKGGCTMSKKETLKTFISQTGGKAKQTLNHAIQNMDQNEDGEFNLTDVSMLANTLGNTVKKGTLVMNEKVTEASKQLEKKLLQPVFPDTLEEDTFRMPKLVRIVERSRKYWEKETCQGSIGSLSYNNLPMINIFQDSVAAFGLSFYPDTESEFYYINPADKNCYIALDDYFNYLKAVRISELQQIAQDLGAKYFKITYKEERSSLLKKQKQLQAKAVDAVDVHTAQSNQKYSTVEIAAEMSFPGHAPVMPHLKYMSQDPSIQNLIKMRLHETTPLLHQKFMLNMSISSGMKQSDAIKIDAILDKLKCRGNASVSSEVEKETRRFLEYEISF